ncbi:TPA: hypothetical protein DCZ32_00730, partial [Candidatus Uhrbacteria bacterium]|nr:hypothetical protein [Candidatus Uhrbacteria bacterium]
LKRAPGGNNLHTSSGQSLGELDNTGLVEHRNESGLQGTPPLKATEIDCALLELNKIDKKSKSNARRTFARRAFPPKVVSGGA